MTAIVDTGFFYALLDVRDKHHQKVKNTLQKMGNEALLLPSLLLVELSFLVRGRMGIEQTASMLKAIENSPIQLIGLKTTDLPRLREIMTIYTNIRLDIADAAIVTLAERLNIRRVLTVDQRDFRIIRPKHCPYFEILP